MDVALRAGLFALAGAGLAASVGCAPASQGAHAPAGRPPQPVQLVTLSPRPVQESSEYLAQLTSRQAVDIHPQVTGPLREIYVKPGQAVKAGTPLMEIDPSRDEAALASLQAQRGQRQASVALAQQNFDRAKRLLAPGVVSQQDYDAAQSSLAVAQADLKAADAQIAAQKTLLAYDRVQAPFDGVVGDVPVKVGDAVSPATTVTTLTAQQHLQAYVHVPLDRAPDLQPHTLIQLLGGADGGVMAQSEVGFVAPQADPSTQTLLLRMDFPNGAQLRSDQLVRARVIWTTHPGVLIPVTAVRRLSGQTFAFVAEQGPKGLVAKQVPIEVGGVQGNDQVVTKGLSAGTRVVVSGIQGLADGSPIAPESAKAPAPPAQRAN